MITKALATILISTGVIGTGAVSGLAPAGMEIAAGPLRVESGYGKIIDAKLDSHSPLTLTIDFNDKRRYSIKF